MLLVCRSGPGERSRWVRAVQPSLSVTLSLRLSLSVPRAAGLHMGRSHMRRILPFLVFALLFLGLQASTKADDYVVPAGTLLRCTLDEPNFSSATADIGDPVVCHLNGLREFGHNVLPRGSYLGGHLEAAKEPGHFWGKGYLKIEFDRIGFPTSDVPVPAKVISAKGYKVDKHGDIKGKGHATRDTVEWLLPPLWPWKILTLPARGPRPALKGEEQIVVRLMDDIEIPRVGASYHSYDRPASYHPQSFRKPASYEQQQWATPEQLLPQAQPISQPSSSAAEISSVDAERPAENVADAASGKLALPVQEEGPASSATTHKIQPARLRLLALKSNNVYAVAKYRIDSGSVSYVLPSGATGSVDITEVDWRTTSRLNAEPIASSATQTY